MAAETIKAKLPLVVIAGPTASGKTSLAIRLAEQYIETWILVRQSQLWLSEK